MADFERDIADDGEDDVGGMVLDIGEDDILVRDEDEFDTELAFDDTEDVRVQLFRFCSHFGAIPSDIFADFGANALFLIDGEALLGQCFENHLVDWQYGGEHLHALFLFLFYLQQFKERDARFRVIFFENCENLWSPSKRLTRFLVINHITRYTQFDIDILTSLAHEDFNEYLDHYLPTNIMTKLLWKDGDEHPSEMYDGAVMQHMSRSLALQSLINGRSVFLMEEGITFRGPRVHMFTMFYRSTMPILETLLAKAIALLPCSASPEPQAPCKHAFATVSSTFESLGDTCFFPVGRRLLISWGALLEANRDGLFDESPILKASKDLVHFFSKLFMLHSVLLQFRPPQYRAFSLPLERPSSPILDGLMDFLKVLYPMLLSFSKHSCSDPQFNPKIRHTESDLWDSRALVALIFGLFQIADGATVVKSSDSKEQIAHLAQIVGVPADQSDQFIQLIQAFDESKLLDGAPFFPLVIPSSDEEIAAVKKYFQEGKTLNEIRKARTENISKVVLSWTDTPDMLNDCVPEVCDILDSKDHNYFPPDETEEPNREAWAVDQNIQDPDHFSFSVGVKVTQNEASRAYYSLVGVSVALSKAKDVHGNDEVARHARDCAQVIFRLNRTVADEIDRCVDKRNWLDLQKIVMRQIKKLDPIRMNQKQGDFFNKYAESLIGGPVRRQSIREVSKGEDAAPKKEEKSSKAHYKGKGGKVPFAKKNLQELELALHSLQDYEDKKLDTFYKRIEFIVKQGGGKKSTNVKLAWDGFDQFLKDLEETKQKVNKVTATVENCRSMVCKMKALVNQRNTVLGKIDALAIQEKLIGLQWHMRSIRMKSVSIPWWEVFVARMKSTPDGVKNEEWASSLVLDQLLGDIAAVQAWVATAPPPSSSSSSAPAPSKGKDSKGGRGKSVAPTYEHKRADPTQLIGVCVHTAQRFGFPDLAKVIAKDLKFKIPKEKVYSDIPRKFSFIQFQLYAMGPRLPRPSGEPDDRTLGFKPDTWQRELLDIVDKRESALISAPTSSGKTFISFYAMEQVLREPSHGSDLPVIVYVSPTKALVNQVQAEIAARFVKNYHYPGQTICGVFTKDFRYNVENCQILVTVPDCLDVMLFSPQYANWLKRVRWVIFDEVHMISKEGGEVWERLILYLDCPFLALSATVGNPTEFETWLHKVGAAKAEARLPKGKGESKEKEPSRFHLIKHEQRWNDLEMGWVRELKGEEETTQIEIVGINPIGTLDIREVLAHGFPDVKLLPEHCLEVSVDLKRIVGECDDPALLPLKKRIDSLDADNYFSRESSLRILLNDVVVYERLLLELVSDLIKQFPELGKKLVSIYTKCNRFETFSNTEVANLDARPLLDFLKSLTHKEEEEMEGLPAIVFNLRPASCESLAARIEKLLECEQFTAEVLEFCKRYKTLKSEPISAAGGQSVVELAQEVLSKKAQYLNFIRRFPDISRGSIADTFENQSEEDRHMKTTLEILHKAKIRHYNQQIAHAAKIVKVAAKAKAKAESNKPSEDVNPQDDEDGPPIEASVEQFQPGYVNPRFSLCGRDNAITQTVLYEHNVSGDIAPNLIDCLKRGIGVHHVDLPTKYKNAVERLFRSRHLRVIIATETLSLGINMPCRTVIFYGDHAKLDAQMFRQMSGRAGRRNFDLRGKVLFYGTPKAKIKMLLNSKLGEMTGNVPLTPSLALRMFHRHHQVSTKNKAVRHETSAAISRVLHLPFNVCRRGAAEFTIPTQFLFCFEYYLKNRVIEHSVQLGTKKKEEDSWESILDDEEVGVSTKLTPSPMSGLMSRLYYLEPCNMFLIQIILSGAIYRLCKEYENVEERCVALMKVLAHIWGVVSVSQIQHLPQERNELISVVLPPLEGEFKDAVDSHNKIAMETFSNYVRFIAHKKPVTGSPLLPASREKIFDAPPPPSSVLEDLVICSATRSPFAALSGHGDDYELPDDLVNSVKSGYEVDSSLLPTMNHEIGNRKLNAFALDFFRTGRVEVLTRHSHVTRSRAYGLLKDFSISLLGLTIALEKRARVEGPGQEHRELVAQSFKALNTAFEAKFRKAYEKW
mmetsp:Transcript_20064/g.27638  ORF Transcript_20064/g.27638 Transcript_20064/m.27638 type:complete len:2046 (+) Transcript_20064:56-6193(+)|eukprot:CAMPEP_0201482206 /NCGR_PEP_ID=MMETSP0151_2-20130828/6475_1 /ASSEMBLY_ACC=CAM_ASM_000257 /TAXON_ID=200890 /ORGANISM="Paramoeba atlantica, Strain 621/1 / CCAP 1560/9" /LENGTH=2045 /DNA_ID=CAMNT_0047864789 /DNA_START=56 /DNA_END=6193 /DNA_ORIENTATION=-